MSEEFARLLIKNLEKRLNRYRDKEFYGVSTTAITESIIIQIDCIKETMTEMGHEGFDK